MLHPSPIQQTGPYGASHGSRAFSLRVRQHNLQYWPASKSNKLRVAVWAQRQQALAGGDEASSSGVRYGRAQRGVFRSRAATHQSKRRALVELSPRELQRANPVLLAAHEVAQVSTAMPKIPASVAWPPAYLAGFFSPMVQVNTPFTRVNFYLCRNLHLPLYFFLFVHKFLVFRLRQVKTLPGKPDRFQCSRLSKEPARNSRARIPSRL